MLRCYWSMRIILVCSFLTLSSGLVGGCSSSSGGGENEPGTEGPMDDACSSSEFPCDNGTCIPSDHHCNGVDNCGDGSDEWVCPDSGELDLDVITDLVEDNVTDPDESDTGGCGPDEFECENGVCIPTVWQCNEDNDCGDWSDELSCGITDLRLTPLGETFFTDESGAALSAALEEEAYSRGNYDMEQAAVFLLMFAASEDNPAAFAVFLESGIVDTIDEMGDFYPSLFTRDGSSLKFLDLGLDADFTCDQTCLPGWDELAPVFETAIGLKISELIRQVKLNPLVRERIEFLWAQSQTLDTSADIRARTEESLTVDDALGILSTAATVVQGTARVFSDHVLSGSRRVSSIAPLAGAISAVVTSAQLGWQLGMLGNKYMWCRQYKLEHCEEDETTCSDGRDNDGQNGTDCDDHSCLRFCDECTNQCFGRMCGPADACEDGTCGTCDEDQFCSPYGICRQKCSDIFTCEEGEVCNSETGRCECDPVCEDRECGPDRCGGRCPPDDCDTCNEEAGVCDLECRIGAGFWAQCRGDVAYYCADGAMTSLDCNRIAGGRTCRVDDTGAIDCVDRCEPECDAGDPSDLDLDANSDSDADAGLPDTDIDDGGLDAEADTGLPDTDVDDGGLGGDIDWGFADRDVDNDVYWDTDDEVRADPDVNDVCVPNCHSRSCGDDGCGGLCSPPDDCGNCSPTGTCIGDWVYYGRDDCGGWDLSSARGSSTPDPDRCAPGGAARTAVCWEEGEHGGTAWCTYKGYEASDCTGASHIGAVYGCTAGE